MLRGVGDFVVILLFIISSSPCFHSGWPFTVYRSAREKDSEQGSETHFAMCHFIVASSFRSGSVPQTGNVLPPASVRTGHPKRSQISHVVLEKEGQLTGFVWIPRDDTGERASAEVTHAANKFGFYLGKLHSESFHL